MNLKTILSSPVNRRAFLTRMTAAGLGVAAMQLLDGCGGGTSPLLGTPGTNELDPVNFPGILGRTMDEVVLNYALTLEILEADLYRQALNLASGRALTAPLDATAPPSGSTGAYTQKVGNGVISGALAAPAVNVFRCHAIRPIDPHTGQIGRGELARGLWNDEIATRIERRRARSRA